MRRAAGICSLVAAALLLTGCLPPPDDPNLNGATNVATNGATNAATNGAMNGATNGAMNGATNNGQGCDPACDDGQQCDVSNERCVECLGDADCDGETPACDVDAGICVTCTDSNAEACAEGVCDAAANECVDCLQDLDCGGSTPACDEQTCVECTATNDTACTDGVCDTGANVCVECVTNADCTEPGASLCDANACVSCSGSDDCSHLPDRAICDPDIDGGTCVGCYPWSEEADCGTTFCDAETNVCTQTEFGGLGRCVACTADDECMAGHRCVLMQFDDTDYGSYCLPIKGVVDDCPRPFGVNITGRESVSGAPQLTYCGVQETLTTCEAVLGYSDECTTGMDNECGAVEHDAVCETLNIGSNRCSYPCTADPECKPGVVCGGTLGEEYCGGS